MHAKSYDDMDAVVAPWTGEEEFKAIADAIEKRRGRLGKEHLLPAAATNVAQQDDTLRGDDMPSNESQEELKTPPTGTPDPSVMLAPLAPANELRMPIPAMVSGDLPTPTPTPAREAQTGYVALQT